MLVELLKNSYHVVWELASHPKVAVLPSCWKSVCMALHTIVRESNRLRRISEIIRDSGLSEQSVGHREKHTRPAVTGLPELTSILSQVLVLIKFPSCKNTSVFWKMHSHMAITSVCNIVLDNITTESYYGSQTPFFQKKNIS